MIRLSADAAGRAVSFRASKAFYSKQSLAIAAHVFEARADVLLAETGKAFEVELRSKRKRETADELEVLGGEFLNELLNQEYRLLVADFNAKIAELIVTRTLYCAGGGAGGARPRSGEATREFQAEAARLMAEARAEMKAVRPRKVPA